MTDSRRGLATRFLEMRASDLSKSQREEYFSLIGSYREEDFIGAGWKPYEKALQQAKQKENGNNVIRGLAGENSRQAEQVR